MAWHPQDRLALLIHGLLIPPMQMSIGIVFFNSLFFSPHELQVLSAEEQDIWCTYLPP